MTQEEKDLLVKDLCSRLPYGVMCDVGDNKPYTLSRIEIDDKNGHLLDFKEKKDGLDMQVYLSECRPYLLPLSSMTEEQKEELFKFCDFYTQEDWEGKKSEVYGIEIASRSDPLYCYDHNFYIWGVDTRAIDWLNKNHFDYHDLIDKNLAIDCTNLNIY